MPFFSIVTPAWNRAGSIGRCIQSVLSQDFGDFEHIIVDDGSTDDTVQVVRSFGDPRVRLISLEKNSGVCAARRAGTGAAYGGWVVSLDSDWSLRPGALAKLARMATHASLQVGVIGGCVVSDTGETWPTKPPPQRPMDFADYLKWIQSGGNTDYQPCRRREVFQDVDWPSDRRLETQFHLAVASRWQLEISADIIATAHTDASNRITADVTDARIDRKLQSAACQAADRRELLTRFGSQLRRHAPQLYWTHLFFASMYSFLAGERLTGLAYAARAFVRRPMAVQVLGCATAGMLSRRLLCRAIMGQGLRRLALALHGKVFRHCDRDPVTPRCLARGEARE